MPIKIRGNLLGRRREIEELREACHVLEREIADQRKEISKLEKAINSQEEEAEHAGAEKAKLGMRRNTASIRMKQVEESKQSHDKVLEDIQREMKELQQKDKDNDESKESLHQTIARSESDRKAAQEKQAAQTSVLQELEAEEADYTQKIHECNLVLANIRQQYTFLKEKEAAALADKNEQELEYEKSLEGREGADSKLAQAEEEIRINAEKLQTTCSQMEEKAKGLEEIRSRRDQYTLRTSYIFCKKRRDFRSDFRSG